MPAITVKTMGVAIDPIVTPLFARHSESTVEIATSPENLFAYLDDHARLATHMSRSSWRMGGGHMEVSIDDGHGQRIGSRIKLAGRILGLSLCVESAVVERVAPRTKVWQTIGEPRLLVIGPYRMGFDLEPAARGTRLRVYVDYDLPRTGMSRGLGALLGAWYAAWCTRMMARDAQRHFTR